jgi:hypothetical protein
VSPEHIGVPGARLLGLGARLAPCLPATSHMSSCQSRPERVPINRPCHGPDPASVRTFCTVSRRPAGPLAPPPRRPGRHSRCRSRDGRANAGRLARKGRRASGRNHPKVRGRAGCDKGTLAMAHIGLMRAGKKPARSRRQRTGHRPLSNPPLRLLRADPPSPYWY